MKKENNQIDLLKKKAKPPTQKEIIERQKRIQNEVEEEKRKLFGKK